MRLTPRKLIAQVKVIVYAIVKLLAMFQLFLEGNRRIIRKTGCQSCCIVKFRMEA